jgi:very-long-chain enoyl-CoA reductase
MVVGHYLKRELETLFVHRFSNDTMPLFNLFKNCAHYWFIFGFINMYFFLHPDYTAPAWASQRELTFIGIAFALFEFMNLMCHITLRNLRKPGSTDRGIPKGWGFDLVSCANYFWESLCWLAFAIQAQSIGGNVPIISQKSFVFLPFLIIR